MRISDLHKTTGFASVIAVDQQLPEYEWGAGFMADIGNMLSYPNRLSPDQVGIDYSIDFTRNENLINQYKLLRKELHGIDPRFVGFRYFDDIGGESYDDPDDQMLIIHNEHHVYGGACIRISMPQHPLVLQIEQDILPAPEKFYFSLREQFPEMALDKYAYAEFGRFLLHPDIRTSIVIKRMLFSALQRCLDYRARYFFILSDRTRTRLYKRIYASVGVECVMCDTLDIPMRSEYEGIKMHLLMGDLKNFFVSPSDPEAASLLNPDGNFEFY